MLGANVLVIDDDPAAREAVAEDLKREGFDLFFAENSQEGLRLIQEVAPTVIILDLRMPVMDGREFLDNINLRPSDRYSVIVLTGHGDSMAVKACYETGVSSFIKKPFNLFEIRGVVKNAIAAKQLTTQLDEMVQERTVELEQRMREVTALNKFFHETLNRAAERDAESTQIMRELQELAPRAADLARRTIRSAGPIESASRRGRRRRVPCDYREGSGVGAGLSGPRQARRSPDRGAGGRWPPAGGVNPGQVPEGLLLGFVLFDEGGDYRVDPVTQGAAGVGEGQPQMGVPKELFVRGLPLPLPVQLSVEGVQMILLKHLPSPLLQRTTGPPNRLAPLYR